MTNLFVQHSPGDQLPSADWNSNWILTQESIADLGPWIVSGLVPSAGAGLSVSITSGVASIGGRITVVGTWSIAGLANNTLNHLYLKDDGTGTSNTSGTQPADSVKLGTATTSAGSVISVNTANSSGRQAFVRPENQVPGNVGSPGSLNLASWNATAGDGFEFYGTLPAGAITLPADVVITDPASSSRNLIQATGDFTELTLKLHSGQMAPPFVVEDASDTPFLSVLANGTADLQQYLVVRRGLPQFFSPGSGGRVAEFSNSDTVCAIDMTATADGATFGSSSINFNVYNALAPAPQATLFLWSAEGKYTNAGSITGSDFYLQDDLNHFHFIAQSRAESFYGAITTCFSGSTPQVAFLGAAPVSRPSSTTDLRVALINLGLYTTGGASPLDLNGGTLTANRVTTPQVDIKSTGEIDLGGSAGTAGYVLTSQGAGSACNWTAATSGSLAGLSDVSLSGTAQGDLLYRGASAWNNLAHGTSGQVLQTNGAAANPSWTTSVTGDATLAPAASSRNVIQPTGAAVVPLVIKGAASQSADFFQIEDSTPDVWLSFSAARTLTVGGTYPNTGLLHVRSGPATACIQMDDIGTGNQVNIRPYTGNTILFGTGLTSTTAAQLFCGGLLSTLDDSQTKFASGTYQTIIKFAGSTNSVSDTNTFGYNLSTGTPAAGFGGRLRMQLQDTTTNDQDAAAIDWLWATATHASRKGRLVLNVSDASTRREGMRVETDGSNPMLGFYGSAATTQQTVTGSRGGNAALASLLTALATLGLIVDGSS